MKSTVLDVKVKLSILWVLVMLNMIFADIFSIIVALVNGNVMDIPAEVTTMMAIAAILTNIPIFMIFLARVLPYKANRWANTIAGVFTILYVVGGAVCLPHYLIIASIEIILLLTIIILAFRWRPLIE